MTSMTLQGDSDGNLDCGACGVRAGGNGMFAEGMHCRQGFPGLRDSRAKVPFQDTYRCTLLCRILENPGSPSGIPGLFISGTS